MAVGGRLKHSSGEHDLARVCLFRLLTPLLYDEMMMMMMMMAVVVMVVMVMTMMR